jgi:hypothetical protein
MQPRARASAAAAVEDSQVKVNEGTITAAGEEETIVGPGEEDLVEGFLPLFNHHNLLL